MGESYQIRFKRFGNIKDIESSIEQLLKAAASVPPNSASYPIIMNHLGISFGSRFEWFENIQNLESAIKHQLEAVASIPHNHPDRPGILNNLALLYQRRFGRFGKKEDIDSVINHQLELVAFVPPDNSNRALFLNNLGNSFLDRFSHFGEANDLDSAINQLLEALPSTLPKLNSPQVQVLHYLGTSYLSRFMHSGNVKDIDSSIERLLEAVTCIPLENPGRPSCLSDLGCSYRQRFIRFGERKDIDQSIKQLLEALSSTSIPLNTQVALLSGLGKSHRIRFNRFGERKDIDLSIKLQLEAVSSTPFDSPRYPQLAEDLGITYGDRFKHSRDVKDIDLAIKKKHEAVASASSSDSEIGSIVGNLGTMYGYRFGVFRNAKDVDLGIEKYLEALSVMPLNNPDRATLLYNLGDTYLDRCKINDGPGPNDLEESISNFRLSSLCLNGIPSKRIKGSLEWARLSHKFNNLVSASEAYDQAIRLLPQVAWIGLNAIAQLKELSSNIQTLGCNAAACMISLAEVASEHRDRQHYLGRAIELLDQGRSILWSQTSNFTLELEDLKKVDSDIANDLDNVGKFLAQGCFRNPRDPLSEIDAQLYRRNAEKWEKLVRRIRGLPGFHHFLLPSPISTLRTAAAEGPVVIINSSEYRCDAVIVPAQGDLVLVPLPNITAEELKSLTNQQEELALRKSKPVWIQSKDYNMSSETLEQVLNQTWLLIGEPIAKKFEELGLLRVSEGSSKSRVWWCLTGSLSFLPIHASCPPTKQGIGMMDMGGR